MTTIFSIDWNGENPELYDSIEIQGCKEADDCIEVDNENPEFFSVYLHCREGGVEAVGDFSLLSDARSYANKISSEYGWGVYDYAGEPKCR